MSRILEGKFAIVTGGSRGKSISIQSQSQYEYEYEYQPQSEYRV